MAIFPLFAVSRPTPINQPAAPATHGVDDIMDEERRYHLRQAVLWATVITAAHLVVPSAAHAWHWLHTALSALYLPLIFRAAVWFGLRGGMTAGVGCALLYLGYLALRWAVGGSLNHDQFAFPVVFLFVGWSSGLVVEDARYKRWQRDEVIRRANAAEEARKELPQRELEQTTQTKGPP